MKEAAPQDTETLEDGRAFLEKLRLREGIPTDSEVAVVVAHPDDESIAFGAQLGRFPGGMIIHVTDGAPENPKEWNSKGFGTKQEYADVRKQELNNALDIAGHTGLRTSLGVSDQQAPFTLAQNAERLARLFLEQHTKFVLTHSYEGGHPDHDATAFAVHAARALLQKEGVEIFIIEAPVYRGEGDEIVWQDFASSDDAKSIQLPLTGEDRILKEKLFAAHRSQRDTFPKVSTEAEWLRLAPRYNFNELPNNGTLSRIFTKVGISSEKWLELTNTALKALGLATPSL